jgi:hypothetical protein
MKIRKDSEKLRKKRSIRREKDGYKERVGKKIKTRKKCEKKFKKKRRIRREKDGYEERERKT